MKKLQALVILFLLLAMSGCAAAGDAGQIDTQETAEIYAATINEIYHVDHSFNQAPNWPIVYVLGTTEDQAMLEGPEEAPQELDADLRPAISGEVQGAPFELIWVESMQEVPVDAGDGRIAGGEGIVIELGNIHSQDDGTVQVSFFMTCGGLCGIGKVYVLGEVDGSWQVSGSVGPEIMS